MKALRIEFPADMPLAAIQGLLREHRLKLNMLGGTATHKDYRAERADAPRFVDMAKQEPPQALRADLEYGFTTPVFDDMERH